MCINPKPLRKPPGCGQLRAESKGMKQAIEQIIAGMPMNEAKPTRRVHLDPLERTVGQNTNG